MAVSDRVTVLRKGKYIGTVNTQKTNKQELSNMMVGRPVQLEIHKKDAVPGETVLDVRNLTVPSKIHKNDAVRGVSFQVHKGEILCIAGIDGNGQTELIHGLTGLEKASAGKITLCGEDISNASIRKRSQTGMAHIPEDRHKHGLVLGYTLEQNLVLQKYKEPRFQNHGFIRFGEVRKYAEKLIEEYDVRSGQGPITIARSMSGGNQQKIVIGRSLSTNPKLVILDEPTRGIDAAARGDVYSIIHKLKAQGVAIMLISSDMEEIVELSDRAVVVFSGRIKGELSKSEISQASLMAASFGVAEE